MEETVHLEYIHAQISDHIDLMTSLRKSQSQEILHLSKRIHFAFNSGNKIFFCGNGGSAADSQHMAAEFVGRFEKDRIGFPAIALTVDSSILTAIANDFGWDQVFERQLQALGSQGDVLIAITTSGNSSNVIRAVKKAREMEIYSVALTGGDGGDISKHADYSIVVPSTITARIQEAHEAIMHIVCGIVDKELGKTL